MWRAVQIFEMLIFPMMVHFPTEITFLLLNAYSLIKLETLTKQKNGGQFNSVEGEI